ncbi:hypothetical protein GGR58DRAFT_449871 [Xylaria digitata]|nr:hypothetical protein GGR58DRAFT_449871 [Xylaria digitata]
MRYAVRLPNSTLYYDLLLTSTIATILKTGILHIICTLHLHTSILAQVCYCVYTLINILAQST